MSIKDRQSKIAGLFGASQPAASLPLPPPSTPSPLGSEKKPPLGGRPLISPAAPTRNPPVPVSSLPPRRPTPQLPPPSSGTDLPPPPPPPLSCKLLTLCLLYSLNCIIISGQGYLADI